MDTNWPSFLATAALLLAAVSILYRRQKKNSSSKPSSESNSSLSDFDSSTRPLPAGNYEVFLSFRGPDVRTTFADSLYHFLDHSKIRTFFDDEGLRKGEKIAPSLVQAIQESKIYIPILSQGYASSKWCLEELSLMVKSLNQNQGHILLPIFYFVEPRDARRQEGSYSRAFRQHSRKHDAETVKEWKEALQVVSHMKGWHVTESDGQGAVIDKIFSHVWSHLMGNYRIVTDELIGVESHVKEVRDLLDLDSKGVKIVGIYGMGGIGKTTISKAVYNDVSSRFERSCFLEDIRETLLKNDGAVTLQNKIISSIMRHDSHVKDTSEGIHIIRDKVCKYKVLIVLDNVDRRFEFDNIFGNLRDFSIESRFIMTTRDIRVLDFFEECRLFEAKVMTRIDSFQLFRKHAFGVGDHQEEKEILCEEFVKAAAGLPLALKVIGSLLFRKEKRVWQEKLEELKERPSDTRVHEILKISYNDLTPAEKDIFLDIACFFVGKTKELPFYMWNDCKFYPESSVSSLILRSLLRIDERNQFWMHDHIRDLGRAIVREENIKQSWKRSRIWSEEEALDMLENGKSLQALQTLKLTNFQALETLLLRLSSLSKLGNLKNLAVEETPGGGSDTTSVPGIRILHLAGLGKLHVITISGCQQLTEITGFDTLQSLEELDISYCTSIQKLSGLSTLKNLKNLRIWSGRQLTEMEELDLLESLERLELHRCTSMKKLPNLCHLKKLNCLSISECRSLTSTEDCGIDGLNSLQRLNISWCTSILKLPNLCGLTKLTNMDIIGCTKVTEVMGLERLESLVRLKLNDCASIVRLPDLSALKNLTLLNISGCTQLTEVTGLESLESLQVLAMSRCKSVSKLPDLSILEYLRYLNISKCTQLKEVIGVERLEWLELLAMSHCKSIKQLSDLSGLKYLKHLDIRQCRRLTEIKGLQELKSLEVLGVHDPISAPGLMDGMSELHQKYLM
ncbi:unnamed protein product [Linum tenue]|uniref:TIR domain-containing protein n=1 Tax=Linum tenue TaxID=586396 RepID=A0AAV0KHX6_9ROSI|nr:unnamed protein product [Linum tenue]